MNLNASESNIIPKFNFRDLIIFILPIIIFGLYLVVFRPGVLTAASYSQLHQIAMGRLTTAYPAFHSALEMLILTIFKTPTYIGLFQILIFSLMWMAICKYHRNDLSQSSNEFVFQFIITLIICLIPINAVYSITLSSNILFSYAIMFLCFLIKVMVDKNGLIDTKLILAMAGTLALVSGLNNYGIFIAFISLILIAYYLYKKDAPQNVFIKLIGITMLLMLLVGSFSLIYDVKGSDYDEYTSSVNIPSNDAFEDGINLESSKNEFFTSANSHPVKGYENSLSRNYGNYKYDLLDSVVNMFRENFILDALFNNPILYMIFSVVLLALIYVITKTEEPLLLYVPVLLNMIVCVFTGQNNMYSNLLVFYLIAIICVSFYFKPNLANELSNRAQMTTQPQRVQVPPAFEVEENYVDGNYYSDLEAELEELTLDDINEMLGEIQSEKTQEIEQITPSGDSDLVDEILKEIEMGKK